MKALAAALGVTVVLALPAQAAAPTLTGIQRQLTALKAQVATLKTRLAVVESQSAQTSATVDQMQQTTQNGLQHQQDLTVCNYAVASDNLNQVWHVLVLLGQATAGTSPEPDMPRYDDQGACQRLGITRTR